MAYLERQTAVPGVVLWRRDADPRPAPGRILPDGCMDLIFDGSRLFVAGPDTSARWHTPLPGTSCVGLRFSRGAGPGFLGIAAEEVRDTSPELDGMWPSSAVRTLRQRVDAAGPVEALERWLTERAALVQSPQLGEAVFELAAGGLSVGAMADRLGYGARQLHRRCLSLFGYGPRHLARVLRFQRALATARLGLPLAQVAATAGFADQSHLSREVRDLAGTTPARLLSELAG